MFFNTLLIDISRSIYEENIKTVFWRYFPTSNDVTCRHVQMRIFPLNSGNNIYLKNFVLELLFLLWQKNDTLGKIKGQEHMLLI